MKKPKARVKLTFNTAPEEQPIWIDGRLQSRATPWIGSLPPGKHRVQVGEDKQGSVTIELLGTQPQLWLGIKTGESWIFEQITD